MAGPVRELGDISRAGARLSFTCLGRNCGCKVSRDVREIEEICLARRWSTLWERLPKHFRCPRCGSKAIKLDADFTTPLAPRRRLVSLFERKPKPMPLEHWRNSPINPGIWVAVQALDHELYFERDERGAIRGAHDPRVRDAPRELLERLIGHSDPFGLLTRIALAQGIVDQAPSQNTGVAFANYEAALQIEASRPEQVCGRAWRRTQSDAERAWLVDRAKRRWGGV